jgi:Na+/proline symporter
MAAASILGQNLILHFPYCRRWRLSESAVLRLQRYCVVVIALLSLATAFSGKGAYELLKDAYSMTLVGLFVPLMAGLYWKNVAKQTIFLSMLAGTISWCSHWWLDWEFALEGALASLIPTDVSWLGKVPQEILATFMSFVGLLVGNSIWKTKANVE